MRGDESLLGRPKHSQKISHTHMRASACTYTLKRASHEQQRERGRRENENPESIVRSGPGGASE